MANDVTKKDLQALERNLGKQISDLDKKLEEQKKEFQKGLDEENKIAVNIRHDLEKKIDSINAKYDEHQNAINTLAKAISDLASKLPK